MKCDADIVVVGGGPAGAAAAIQARRSGASVILLEADPSPRRRPGETVHSGAISIFNQLGVETAVERSSGARYDSISVNWAGRRSFDSSRISPTEGRSLGFQIERSSLDALLVERARSLGADVRRPCRALQPLIDDGRIVGVRTDLGELTAASVIDASGTGSWLRKGVSLREELASPRLIARYGYCRSMDVRAFETPCLTGDREGWRWIARVSTDTLAWVSVAFPNAPVRPCKPDPLLDLVDIGPTRGADVTWRRVATCSGMGFFIAGDAAFRVDPAAGHGILRAMMSGMMAAYQAAQMIRKNICPDHVSRLYRGWMAEWWERDTSALSSLYDELDPAWARPRANQVHAQSGG
ncbi:NAD(P)/FAD-dependent oxidoreductase [Bradyrhizobium elkanii]|uniref:NAD(P)/FAD-dependent oxidoreductase n=1 Tax=Bradyrhizobium elkanii TaxID=29448 RepID=UPI0009B6D887|nr:FAD-dependent oxidoreductase [Bradyrhizobium elkanii]